MKTSAVATITLVFVTVSCAAANREVPSDISEWVVTKRILGIGTRAWSAANQTGTVWEVYRENSVVKVREYDHLERSIAILTGDGELTCENNGEWGSTVFWAPHRGRKHVLSKEHVTQFLKVSGELFAISGFAHLGSNEGSVLRFVHEGNDWTVSRLCKLVDKPRKAVQETSDTFLVLTYSGLCRVSIGGWIQLLVASAQWDGLHPSSLVIGEDGLAYVGFSQRVGKIDLKTGDVEYLVPYPEIFDEHQETDSP